MTIPPPSLIDIAHSHGVKVLGTLIFEWEDGGKEAHVMLDGKVAPFPQIYQEILDSSHDPEKVRGSIPTFKFKLVKDSEEGNRLYIRKLVEIAKHFGFDGYLMNFECAIRDTTVLLDWLKELTS